MNERDFGRALDAWLTSGIEEDDSAHEAAETKLRAEFDDMEDTPTRSPREYLLDLCADDVLEAALLMMVGKRLGSANVFELAIDKARSKYVASHLNEVADELREENRAEAEEYRADCREGR